MAQLVSFYFLQMRYRQLIKISKEIFDGDEEEISANVFNDGARWMCRQLNRTGDIKVEFNDSVSYTAYGIIKYSISVGCFIASAFIFSKISIWLVPLSLLVFYVVEVHFLFLFPLLIDGVPQPLQMSVRHTYRMGAGKLAFTVFCIGMYMLAGLLNFSKPLRNWHIGCLAIIIWYQHEVRSRI
jgi:hypothetical protein